MLVNMVVKQAYIFIYDQMINKKNKNVWSITKTKLKQMPLIDQVKKNTDRTFNLFYVLLFYVWLRGNVFWD